MTRSAKMRALAVCVVLAACFTIFSYRLIDVQVAKHEDYAALAAAKHVTKQIIYASRGVIEDINGEVLADNEPTRVCVADGALVNKPGEIADLLAGPFGMSRAELEQKLTTDRRWAPIKRPVSEAVAN